MAKHISRGRGWLPDGCSPNLVQLKIRRLIILFLAGVLLCLNPGCLYIPQQHKNIELSGKRIEEEKLGFVVPGKTTKTEFIDKVGQPYLVMDDWGVMAYYWKMLAAYVPWLLVGSTGAGGGVVQLSNRYMLLVAYDGNGCITKYETIHPFLIKTVNERAIEWAGKGELLEKFTPGKIPADKSVVYVYRVGGWLDGFNEKDPTFNLAGVFLDGKLWAELDNKQFTAMVLPPGTHKIGLEPRIRATDLYLDPRRKEKPEPSVTTTIDTLADKAYFLEIKFIRSDHPEERKPYFARPSPDEARQILAWLKRAR